MRRFFDGLIILFVLGAVVSRVIDGISEGPPERRPAPEYVPDRIAGEGRDLPPPSERDRRVYVESSTPSDSIGTAWPVDETGIWLTARHVTEGCRALELVVDGTRYPVSRVMEAETGDLAVIWTPDINRPGLALRGPNLQLGVAAWGYGWPSGNPGAVEGALLGRQTMISRTGREPVLAWVDRRRVPSRLPELGGISGGPVLFADGTVTGALVAGSERRGRFFTTAPGHTAQFLRSAGISNGPARWQTVSGRTDSVGTSMERDLRAGRTKGAIGQVLCYVQSAGRRPSPRRWSGVF